MHDVLAVMDAAGSERAVLFGYSEGGPMAILMAAMHPERARALVLYGTYARRLHAYDYPWAPRRRSAGRRSGWARRMELGGRHAGHVPVRGRGDGALVGPASPGGGHPVDGPLSHRDELLDRHSGAPFPRCGCRHWSCTVEATMTVRVEEGRYLAEHIPGARFVELSGADHFVAVNQPDPRTGGTEFLGELGSELVTPSRALGAVLAVLSASESRSCLRCRGAAQRGRQRGNLWSCTTVPQPRSVTRWRSSPDRRARDVSTGTADRGGATDRTDRGRSRRRRCCAARQACAAGAPYREKAKWHWQKSGPSLEDVFIDLMGRAKDNFQ